MKAFGLALLAISLLAASRVSAQQPDDPFAPPAATKPRTAVPAPTISPGEVQATPEMWFYEQERLRYQDPKNAVRANAEFRAAQRMRRLAAMKWYGFSNSRPRANTDPVHGTYSPRWVSNGYMPSQWAGVGNTTVVIAQDRVRRY